jgi:hypothetical protein
VPAFPPSAADYLLYSSTYRTVPNGTLLFYIFAGIGAGAVVLTPIVRVRSFPPPVRVTGVSFSYNTAYAMLGGITPPMVGWLSHLDRMAPAHCSALAAFTAFAIMFLSPRANR